VFERPRPSAALIALTIVLISAMAATGALIVDRAPTVSGQTEVPLRVVGSAPLNWDPAHAGDAGSAAVLAQVFEGLTTLDSANNVRPALAESWTIASDGRSIDFKLRPGLHYSDATAIVAQDVVDSWLRLLDPQRPSPLYSLLADVEGAVEYVSGAAGRDAVGVHAQGDHVIVDLRRPATYFLAVTSSPSLAVVPPAMAGRLDSDELPAGMVVSGGYLPTGQSDVSITLEGNGNYWIGGSPPIDWIELVTDTEDRDPIDLFEAGDLDYVPVGSFNAAWLRYDANLGPQLRTTADLSIHFYGFDTTRPPFDDVLVRRSFAQAVDWERIVHLANGQPARSIVPRGMPGGGSENYRPTHEPDQARDLLAQAGFAGGAGFPDLTLTSSGFGYEMTVATELERELGVDVTVELLDFGDLISRQAAGEQPLFWNQTWSADYPHAHDFLGLLLESGSNSNDSRFSNAPYDAEIAAAAATADPAEQERHYAAAQAILRDEVPVVPVEALTSFALGRNGLLGALPSGAGYFRFAGLAWADGSGR
jgi:oligopeptide transport system substrate-binding protein